MVTSLEPVTTCHHVTMAKAKTPFYGHFRHRVWGKNRMLMATSSSDSPR
jgi:hypothetical protein